MWATGLSISWIFLPRRRTASRSLAARPRGSPDLDLLCGLFCLARFGHAYGQHAVVEARVDTIEVDTGPQRNRPLKLPERAFHAVTAFFFALRLDLLVAAQHQHVIDHFELHVVAAQAR